jgi:alkylated DNA nucleotide flippase Atl1
VRGTVTADGQIEVAGKLYATPSNAGYHVKGGRAANGWTFWHLEDGRRLTDVRALYRGEKAEQPVGFDWSRLHELLEALPEGAWTSYSELADAIGTAPQPLGGHIARCRQCANAWRVLTSDGRVASGFAWTDAADDRSPEELLRVEGVLLPDGSADPSRKLDSDALTALLDEED